MRGYAKRIYMPDPDDTMKDKRSVVDQVRTRR